MWKGIDVSDNQGRIGWNRVKEAGCRFAVLRSVRRSGRPDHQFEANVSGCRENGIPFEVYKYTCASVPSRAAEEAEQVVARQMKEDLRGVRDEILEGAKLTDEIKKQMRAVFSEKLKQAGLMKNDD